MMNQTQNSSSQQVLFFDTTLRDGEQSPGCTMHPAEKLRMAQQLAALGVDILEAGFPIASAGDFESVRSIARDVRGPRIAALARAKREDIESAARAIEPAACNRIHTFLSSSDIHLEHQMRISRAEALDQAGAAVRLACSLVEDVEFSPMDATRSEHGFLVEMVTVAVQAGAKTINIPDTVGYTTPEEYKAIFAMLLREVPVAQTSSSPHTVMTISAWRWRTHWRVWRAGHGRWSARSTGLVNAQAMRRLKRLRPP